MFVSFRSLNESAHLFWFFRYAIFSPEDSNDRSSSAVRVILVSRSKHSCAIVFATLLLLAMCSLTVLKKRRCFKTLKPLYRQINNANVLRLFVKVRQRGVIGAVSFASFRVAETGRTVCSSVNESVDHRRRRRRRGGCRDRSGAGERQGGVRPLDRRTHHRRIGWTLFSQHDVSNCAYLQGTRKNLVRCSVQSSFGRTDGLVVETY